MAAPNSTYTELVTTTLENRRRAIADNVTNTNALLAWLKKSGNVDLASGGRTLVEELSYAENQTFAWYDGYELINITPQQTHSAAEYSWKQAAASVSISGGELAMNSGKERMIPLLKARVGNCEDSMTNNLGTAVYSDGTGSGGKEIGGTQLLIADAPGTGTVGGIDRNNFSFWRNQFKDAATVFSSLTASGVQALMQEIWTECLRGTDVPDVIFAGSNAFTTFWNSLLDIQRITSAEKGASGFKSLEFMGPQGSAPVFFDPQCNTNRMYFINSKYLKFRPHRDRNMIVTDQRTSINQDAVVVLLLWMGNLTLSNAARQGVIFD